MLSSHLPNVSTKASAQNLVTHFITFEGLGIVDFALLLLTVIVMGGAPLQKPIKKGVKCFEIKKCSSIVRVFLGLLLDH